MLEIVYLGLNSSGFSKVYSFIGRIVFGLFIALFIGPFIDKFFNSAPFITIGLVIYFIFGSLYLFVKDFYET